MSHQQTHSSMTLISIVKIRYINHLLVIIVLVAINWIRVLIARKIVWQRGLVMHYRRHKKLLRIIRNIVVRIRKENDERVIFNYISYVFIRIYLSKKVI